MVTFFFAGVAAGFVMRLVQLTRFHDLISAQTYNALFTFHGVVMIFLFVIPGLKPCLAISCCPSFMGAKDVAFPRLNLASWYFFIAWRADCRWSRSSPAMARRIPVGAFTRRLVSRPAPMLSLAVFAAFILGFSSMLTGINFITTIHRLRAPGMTFFRMPLFPWAVYATSWIQILATPVLAVTLLLVILERAVWYRHF